MYIYIYYLCIYIYTTFIFLILLLLIHLSCRHLIGSWDAIANVGVQGPYHNAVDTVCFPHTMHCSLGKCKEQGVEIGMLLGANFNTFMNHSNGLMSSAQSNGKLIWRRDMGSAYPSPGETRWGTHYETMGYILPSLIPTDPNFIGPALSSTFDEKHPDFPMTYAKWVSINYKDNGGTLSGNHIKYLFQTLVPGNPDFDEHLLALIEFEAAVAVDVSLPIRYGIYQSEGDGPLSFLLVDVIEAIHKSFVEHWDEMTYPNVQFSLLKNVDNGIHPSLPGNNHLAGPALCAAWVDHGIQLARRCRSHFYANVYGHNMLPLYRELVIFDPLFFSTKEASWNTQPGDLADSLREWFVICLDGDKKLIDEHDIDLLAAEVPAMRIRCRDALLAVNNFVGSINKIDVRCEFIELFWMRACTAADKNPVPTWYKYASKLMILQPNSATVERVFSILDYFLNAQCAGGQPLVDYIEAQVMLKFNSASREHLAVMHDKR